jgi:hypothetical protein
VALNEIDALDFDAGQVLCSIPANPASESELLEDQRALKTHGAAKEVFGNIAPMPIQFPPLLQKISELPPRTEAVTQAAAGTTIAAQWPNPGKEALDLGLKKEKSMIENLNNISSTIDGIQDKLAHILSFNRKLNKLSSDKSPYAITDEMKEDIAALKAMGIDLLSENETELSPEKLASLKTTLETEKSQLNTAMQIQCTKIQTNTQQYSSLLDSLKVIEKHVSRLHSTIIDNMKR